jgi:hypothetical protein
VLTARVRIAVGDERAEHLALDRPGPRLGSPGSSQHEEDERRRDESRVADFDNHAGKGIEPISRCQI